MTTRTRTLVVAGFLAVALIVLGAVLPVPLIALGPGPTFNTLGDAAGHPVVSVDGVASYPASGHLNMTTVSVTEGFTLWQALGFWASPTHRVEPRSAVFPPGLTDQQVRQQNDADFASSESSAVAAALHQLGLPTSVTVGSLVPDSPAAGKLAPGDVIVQVNGTPTDTADALTGALATTRPGDTAHVVYLRDGVQHSADVVLGTYPGHPQGLLGITPQLEPRGGSVTIQLGGIGGPSAGLMFSLAVVDKLTPGDLTGGKFVAGTGTITPDGAVGPIDGVPFKMRAARDAGATVFLVPDRNCAEAASTAPAGLQLVRVSTLGNAVSDLDALKAGRPVPSCA